MLTFAVMRKEREWPETIVKGFQLIAQVFANALARKRAEEQLKKQVGEIEELKQRLERENIFLREEVRLLVEHADIVGSHTPQSTHQSPSKVLWTMDPFPINLFCIFNLIPKRVLSKTISLTRNGGVVMSGLLGMILLVLLAALATGAGAQETAKQKQIRVYIDRQILLALEGEKLENPLDFSPFSAVMKKKFWNIS